ncbi:hypothetical protein [Halosimplex sp. J119]
MRWHAALVALLADAHLAVLDGRSYVRRVERPARADREFSVGNETSTD